MVCGGARSPVALPGPPGQKLSSSLAPPVVEIRLSIVALPAGITQCKLQLAPACSEERPAAGSQLWHILQRHASAFREGTPQVQRAGAATS